MKLKVFPVGIATGGVLVVLLNETDAQNMDLHVLDRVFIKKNNKFTTAIVDIAARLGKEVLVPRGHMGVFEEVRKKLDLRKNELINVHFAKKPSSISFIRNKLDGKELTPEEIDRIIRDVVNDELSVDELTYFVAGCYTRGLSNEETIALTKATVKYGDQLHLKDKIVMDKHSIGGVPGNRTTMIIVPILAAAGITIPKTSSRSITSPSGTADTMEVLAPVSLTIEKMKRIVRRTGGCMAWGGAMSIAAADDKLIKIRHSMSLDPEGLLLASILAKKAAVNATHVLIDIPIGKDTKIKSHKEATHLANLFRKIGHRLDMSVHTIITQGGEPIGNGIGPSLEARDVLWVLQNDSRAPLDLRDKSLMMAGKMLEIAGITNGRKVAEAILETGKAYEKMKEIIKAQGGDPHIESTDICVGPYKKIIKASKKGVVFDIDNKCISKIARIAGAPTDKCAGIYLHVHVKDHVQKGDALFTLYAQQKERLEFALEVHRRVNSFVIK